MGIKGEPSKPDDPAQGQPAISLAASGYQLLPHERDQLPEDSG
jgi:hypothetical protein